MSSSELEYEDIHLTFQPLPFKPLILSVILLIVGSGLIITGFIEEAVDIDPTRGIAFWVLGSLTVIPGGYFSYRFFQAWRAKTPEQRRQILEEIPET